jgi:hypothetical protein
MATKSIGLLAALAPAMAIRQLMSDVRPDEEAALRALDKRALAMARSRLDGPGVEERGPPKPLPSGAHHLRRAHTQCGRHKVTKRCQ